MTTQHSHHTDNHSHNQWHYKNIRSFCYYHTITKQ